MKKWAELSQEQRILLVNQLVDADDYYSAMPSIIGEVRLEHIGCIHKNYTFIGSRVDVSDEPHCVNASIFHQLPSSYQRYAIYIYCQEDELESVKQDHGESFLDIPLVIGSEDSTRKAYLNTFDSIGREILALDELGIESLVEKWRSDIYSLSPYITNKGPVGVLKRAISDHIFESIEKDKTAPNPVIDNLIHSYLKKSLPFDESKAIDRTQSIDWEDIRSGLMKIAKES